ncbi:hypothetical protein BO71DRAFT_210885 [Aspergillus ellipticus CBS 707.79]|uniref:Uncharacterized protein n=1 Tax=Aspergillus ellipticus CBS 707.79 TaxID=1448320 RepID=A0A319DCM4_9EURO|nr:hypothetical protein BO71DRAFT_210885 [Aspergillus ellipticus CBS 707.79]
MGVYHLQNLERKPNHPRLREKRGHPLFTGRAGCTGLYAGDRLVADCGTTTTRRPNSCHPRFPIPDSHFTALRHGSLRREISSPPLFLALEGKPNLAVSPSTHACWSLSPQSGLLFNYCCSRHLVALLDVAALLDPICF